MLETNTTTFSQYILHEHVIMPNHVHGIIELILEEWSENFLTLQKPKQHEFQKVIPRSIATIIRGFKIGVTKWFRKNSNIHDVWQSSYYDEIIRDKKAYYAVSTYIKNNPKNCGEDIYNNIAE